MRLTIIIPAYNEEKTIGEAVKQAAAVKLKRIVKEIIVVNDGSTDGTKSQIPNPKSQKFRLKIINKSKNEGKGAAIRDAMRVATGDMFIIQDADLEYDPRDYPLLLAPILEKKADVVFGSRFAGGGPHRVLYFWHMAGNMLLTLLTNMVTNLNLTDMETCYKVFTKEVAKDLNVEENRFGWEPEFTIKAARAGWRIYEVGISYSGRDYAAGKKINWRDGVWALWCIVKYGCAYKYGLI